MTGQFHCAPSLPAVRRVIDSDVLRHRFHRLYAVKAKVAMQRNVKNSEADPLGAPINVS